MENNIYYIANYKRITICNGATKAASLSSPIISINTTTIKKNAGLFAQFGLPDTFANQISYYHLLLLLCSLPFNLFYSHIILVSFAAHTFIHLKKDKLISVFKPQTLILQSVFWITLIGISYSPNKSEGFTQLGRQIVIVVFPILCSLTTLNIAQYRDKLLFVFSVCITATVCYLYWDAVTIIRFYQYPFNTLFSEQFTNHNFSDAIGMHASFLSLQVAIALVYMFLLFFKKHSPFKNLVYGCCCLILGMGLIQLGCKAVCAATFFIVCIAIPVFQFKKKQRVVYILSAVLSTCLCIVITLQSQALKQRFVDGFKSDISISKPGDITDSRLARWTIVADLIKSSPIVGIGSGIEQQVLGDAFFKNKLYNSYLHKLNAHNEYLSILLCTGIMGFILYLFTLGYFFKYALVFKDNMLLAFLILVATVCLSENLFDVDKGTMFYGVLLSILFYGRERQKKGQSSRLNNHGALLPVIL